MMNINNTETIQSHLWPTMSLSELSQQREIIVDRLNMLNSLINQTANPMTIQHLHESLNFALGAIDEIITNYSKQL